jgi:allophanate hydrolase subunit 1
VAGFRAVLVHAAGPDRLDAVRYDVLAAAQGVEAAGGPTPGAKARHARSSCEVRYDGPDLVPLAGELRLSADVLVARHIAGRYTIAFCGFAPGFAYLTGLDRRLWAARLSEPRTAVRPTAGR